MSRPTWAVELAFTDADKAQALRLVHGVEARYADDQSTLWLRGSEVDQSTLQLVRRLPSLQRMSLLEDGRGVPEGKTVPTVNLTGSGWVPLRHLSPLRPPRTQAPGSEPAQVKLQVAPSATEAPATVLCIPFQAWHDYALMAPAIRLAGLRFAVSDDARALIHGIPLPPLRGQFFHINHGIATPAGFTLSPPVDPGLLASRFRLNEGDILLFHTDSTCELISATGLTLASRSAVRESATALAALEQ